MKVILFTACVFCLVSTGMYIVQSTSLVSITPCQLHKLHLLCPLPINQFCRVQTVSVSIKVTVVHLGSNFARTKAGVIVRVLLLTYTALSALIQIRTFYKLLILYLALTLFSQPPYFESKMGNYACMKVVFCFIEMSFFFFICSRSVRLQELVILTQFEY